MIGYGRNRSVHYFASRSFVVRRHRGAQEGNRSDQSGESILNGFLFRSKYCFWSNLAFIYLREEWRPVKSRRFYHLRFVLEWYT